MRCINPVFVRKAGLFVRCGRCLPCQEATVKEWAVRLEVELENARTAYFFTLTFEDAYLELYPELDKSQFQRFLKRLRQYVSRGLPDTYEGKKINKIEGKTANMTYFAVGEYGKKFNRPHWHVLFFNLPYNHEDSDIIVSQAWREKDGCQLGFIRSYPMQIGAIHYTVEYMFKDQTNSAVRLMSKHLGEGYVNQNTINYHQKTLKPVMRVNYFDRGVSRYYAKKLFNQKQRIAIGEEKSNYFSEELEKNPYSVQEQYHQLIRKVKHKKSKK